ncbi:hypothetical protein N9D07_03500, partial [Alphaproteobacteria bacterium]|nr:hypothetical protein [Alphaproteobacteria bacterium]
DLLSASTISLKILTEYCTYPIESLSVLLNRTWVNCWMVVKVMFKLFGSLIISSVFVFFFAGNVFAETVTLNDLVKRDGLTYKKFSTKPYSGEVAAFFANGQLGDYGNYKNGKKIGVWTTYFTNGDLGSKENWSNGERHGLFEMFWPNGKLRVLGQYSYGQQSGKWNFYDEAGNLSQKQDF